MSDNDSHIPDPPGYARRPKHSTASNKKPRSAEDGKSAAAAAERAARYNQRRAWDLALGAGKAIPMNAFMMWMAGNSIQIFSIAITVMMFWQGLKGLGGSLAHFRQFTATSEGATAEAGKPSGGESALARTAPFLPQIALYAVFQLCLVSLGLYKCNTMGLLPTSSGDWLFLMGRPSVMPLNLLL